MQIVGVYIVFSGIQFKDFNVGFRQCTCLCTTFGVDHSSVTCTFYHRKYTLLNCVLIFLGRSDAQFPFLPQFFL